MGKAATAIRLAFISVLAAGVAIEGCSSDPLAVSTEALTDPRCPAGMPVIVGTSGPDTLTGTNAAECILGLECTPHSTVAAPPDPVGCHQERMPVGRQ